MNLMQLGLRFYFYTSCVFFVSPFIRSPTYPPYNIESILLSKNVEKFRDDSNETENICKLNSVKAIGKQIAKFILATSTFLSCSYADDQWDDRNRLAAELWRTVDEIYYDRSFNGNDWFAIRQSIVKKSYKNDEEVEKNSDKIEILISYCFPAIY